MLEMRGLVRGPVWRRGWVYSRARVTTELSKAARGRTRPARRGQHGVVIGSSSAEREQEELSGRLGVRGRASTTELGGDLLCWHKMRFSWLTFAAATYLICCRSPPCDWRDLKFLADPWL